MKRLRLLGFLAAPLLLLACQSPIQNLAGKTVLTPEARAVTTPQVIEYPVPAGLPANATYGVQVRSLPSGAWQDLFEHDIPVDQSNNPAKVSAVSFDFDGSVEVKVTYNAGGLSVGDIKLLPRSFNLTPANVTTNSFTFQLDNPKQVTVEIKNQDHNTLHVLTNSVPVNPPTANAAGLMYFGPGIHDMTNDSRIVKDTKLCWVNNGGWSQVSVDRGVLTVPSNTRVYLAGGAVLKAKILVKDATGVTIEGHGMIDQRSWNLPGTIEGIELNHASNVTINDLVFLNANHYVVMVGQSNVVNINRIKGFSCYIYGDGIDMMSSNDVTVNDIFLRTMDDGIAIYGQRVWEGWDFRGDSARITVTNAILWPDIAHGINIGCHGNLDNGTAAPLGNLLKDMTFRNIEILYHNNGMSDPNLVNEFQGTLAIDVGDGNIASNILFENVNVERIKAGQLVNFITMNGSVFNGGIGKRVENVTLRNLNYYGDAENNDTPSRIKGYDATRIVTDIKFENFRVGGTLITAANAASLGKISVEANAFNVTYSGGGNPTATLTSPASGSTADTGVAVALTATATDSDGTITKVEFFQGATLIATDTSAPYSATWTPTVAGTYSLTARATDNSQLIGDSMPVSYVARIVGPPTVSITSPVSGSSADAGVAVAIAATAADANGSISSVAFYQGTTLISTDTTAPYQATWTPTVAGTYSLTAVATDNQGNSTTSAAVAYTASFVPIAYYAKIEAENADYKGNVTIVATTDVGGGQAITGYDSASGDWSTHPFTPALPATQTYTVRLRVASTSGGATVDLEKSGGGQVYGTVTIPTTGGMETWTTLTKTLTLPAGIVTLGVNLKSGGPNFSLNWIEIQAGTVTPPANVAPTVSLTAPSSGSSATVNTAVTLSANAADSDGTVSKVEFFQGTTLLGSDTSSPYSLSWAPTATGTYSLTAKATDNSGAVTTSTAVSFTANAAANVAPTASMTAPSSGSSATVNTAVTLSANAADSDGTVSKVEFFQGTTMLGTDTSSPYSLSWTPTATGTYSLTAKATDNSGAVTTSAAVSFTVSAASSFPAAGTVYRIVNRGTGAALDVTGGSTVDGGDIITWAWNAGSNQKWTFTSLAGGYFAIYNQNSGKVAGVSGGSIAGGGDVIQWGYSSSALDQQWQIVATDSGFYKIVNRKSGMAMGLNGSNVVQWTFNGGDNNNHWKIEVAP